MIADGEPEKDREGAGRMTSALELYYYTWDNNYLDFAERTLAYLLRTQKEDGAYPQLENFAPFLQRYVTLTGIRIDLLDRARKASSLALKSISVEKLLHVNAENKNKSSGSHRRQGYWDHQSSRRLHR